MKNRIWLLQIPSVIIFTFAFWVTDAGVQGNLQNGFLRETLFPRLRTVTGWFTNVKFFARGAEKPKNNIVIVEIDNDAIANFGRWPWHRDTTADLVMNIFMSGAKAVGLDIVFSESDQRVSPKLREALKPLNIDSILDQHESDPKFTQVIDAFKERLVLGYAIQDFCQPLYSTAAEPCPASDPEVMKSYPQGFEKFAFSSLIAPPPGFDQGKTPLIGAIRFIPNIDAYNEKAEHAGYFNAWPDRDGFIRRTSLLVTAGGKAYPSLPLEMARIGLGEKLEVNFDRDQQVESMKFANSGRRIPVSPVGAMEVNFRGPARTFEYISAYHLLLNEDEIKTYHEAQSRTLASDPANGDAKKEVEGAADLLQKVRAAKARLKDAYVLVGLSALGVFDMRAFPFDSNTPGVEGHASILDNLLSGDMLIYGSSESASIWIFLFMTVGALVFAIAVERLESIPALALFLAVMGLLGFVDVKVLFANYLNWNTSFLFLELVSIFVFVFAVKYVMEEKNKKFIKGAFAKYVSPAIIDSIMKDPSKLTVGGEKRDLTILFSDIRGFTTFSERMDAKALAGFLNDYLGQMTDIVFDTEGTLDKYIGDAVMAFWGAPLDQPKHAANACKAAIKMQQLLAQHYERFKTQYGVEVAIGIGINSGAVNVGNMGSERIFEYTVIGDHVNLASRLEGLTKYYGVKIVTTRFTFDDIIKSGEPLPPHRVLDFVKVKGKKTAVELIQVLEKAFSPEGLKAFEEARGLYTSRDFDGAIAKFEQANVLLRASESETDEPCQMYIERCKELKQSPPSADWDGSWEMHSK